MLSQTDVGLGQLRLQLVGVALERRLFSLLFSTRDQKEGMAAFIEKRPADWQGH